MIDEKLDIEDLATKIESVMARFGINRINRQFSVYRLGVRQWAEENQLRIILGDEWTYAELAMKTSRKFSKNGRSDYWLENGKKHRFINWQLTSVKDDEPIDVTQKFTDEASI